MARVTDTTFCKLSGASGLVKILAPVPTVDHGESPLTLVAYTLAYMSEPHSMLYGIVISSEIGTKHDKSVLTYC